MADPDQDDQMGVSSSSSSSSSSTSQSLREALQGHDIPENVILILKEHQISFNDLKQGWILEGDFQEMEIAIGPKRRLLALHSTPDPAPAVTTIALGKQGAPFDEIGFEGVMEQKTLKLRNALKEKNVSDPAIDKLLNLTTPVTLCDFTDGIFDDGDFLKLGVDNVMDRKRLLNLKRNQMPPAEPFPGYGPEGDFQEMEIAIGPKRRLLPLHSTPDPAPGQFFAGCLQHSNFSSSLSSPLQNLDENGSLFFSLFCFGSCWDLGEEFSPLNKKNPKEKNFSAPTSSPSPFVSTPKNAISIQERNSAPRFSSSSSLRCRRKDSSINRPAS